MTVNEILVSAVMPCLNEEKTLGLCIAKVQRAFDEMGIAGEVVVADNGSTDRSVEIAESHGARVVHERRKGYGSALLAGIATARGRIVIMADADDSYDWAALGDFVRKIDEGYDLVMGNRFKGGIEPGAMPPLHRYLGNPVLSTLARVMYRIPVNDFHFGMGGREEIFINARVLAATNRDLKQAISDGKFREDLYYRLGVVTIQLPPIREREDDILVLATAMLQRYADENRKKITGFTKPAIRAVETHDWPGNIRELENRIKRAVIMAEGSKIAPEDLELLLGFREI